MAAANIDPVYSKVGKISWGTTDSDGTTAGPIKTASTTKDGTTSVVTIFTADATNGSFVKAVRARAAGTCTASVLRIFINNGSATGTIANNILYTEATLPATTINEVAALLDVDVPINLMLPPGYKLTVAIGTTVSAGWCVSAIGGSY